MFIVKKLYYGDKRFPTTPTIDVRIDTSMWFLGLMITRFDDLQFYYANKNTQIGFLCFTIRVRKFI